MSKSPNPSIPENLNLAIRYLSQQFRHHNNNLSRQSSPPPELFKLRQIHSLLVVSGFSGEYQFLTRILLHCVSLPSFPSAYAFAIFDRIRRPNVFTYNALIKGFSFHPEIAVHFYVKMRKDGVFPNMHTFPLLLKSKTQIPFQIFSQAIKFGFGSDQFLQNSLVSVWANCGLIEYARKVFDDMTQRDTVAYTALMDGYIRNNQASRALDLFLEMRVNEVGVDEGAVVSALCAAGILGCVWFGKWIHGFFIETGRVVRDIYVGSALIDMYSKCNCCEDALKVFQNMPYKNAVSWSALLSGYVHCNRFEDGLLLFQEILVQKIEPNEVILATVLTCCAHLGSLDQGKWVDDYINKREIKLNSVLGTALIDMYAKCGCMNEAFRVFERMNLVDVDVYVWTALIFGVAINGDAINCLNLFTRMLSSGVKPNGVTFIAVLTACSHGGLVNDGRKIFKSMGSVYGVVPTVDHYTCMVDILGRAGRLREAADLIEDMPMEASGGILGALFGACVKYGDFEMGEIVGNRLIELEPRKSGGYVLLANLYSRFGDWEKMADVRKKMNGVGVEKIKGCSWIELDGVTREFLAFEKSDLASESVYEILDKLTDQMLQQQQLPFVLEDETIDCLTKTSFGC